MGKAADAYPEASAASRAWLEQLAKAVREAGAGFSEAELRDAFDASLAKTSGEDVAQRRRQRLRMAERFLRIVAGWRCRVSEEDRDHARGAAALLEKVYGDRLETFAGASACFARGSLELEAAVDLLQRKLKVLADLDGGAGKTFARWAERAKKHSHHIGAAGFRRLVAQVLRGRAQDFTPKEVELVIMRYIDTPGLGVIDKETFDKFLYSSVPHFCEHAIWASSACMREDPKAIVEVRALSSSASKMQRLELADQGFERTIGADLGIWTRRAARSSFLDASAFQRARVTDIVCQWTKGPSVAADAALTRQGFVLVPVAPIHRSWTSHLASFQPSAAAQQHPRVWIRRNPDDPRALCNVFVGSEEGMPPCQDLRRVDVRPEVEQQESASSSLQREQKLCLFVRKLRCDGGEAKKDLEVEFEKIASGLGAGERTHEEARESKARALRVEKIRADLVDQLVAQTLETLTSPDDSLRHQLPDTDLLIERARDEIDALPEERRNGSKRTAKPIIPGHLTRRKACKVLDQVGVTVPSAQSLKELLVSLEGKQGHAKRLVPMQALRDLLVFNPARTQQLLVEVCRVHGPKVLECLGKRSSMSKSAFVKAMQPILSLTPYEFQEWELAHVAHVLADKHRPDRIVVARAREIVASVLGALRDEAQRDLDPAALQVDGNGKDAQTLQDFVVESFGDPRQYLERFAELTGRQPDTSVQISLGRLKSIMRKRTLASEEQIFAFIAEHGLQDDSFVNAGRLHEIARRLIDRVSPLRRPEDGSPQSAWPSSEDEDVYKAFEERKTTTGPESLALDRAALLGALCSADAFTLKALLRSKSTVSENELCLVLSRTGARLSHAHLSSLVELTRVPGSPDQTLCTKKMLRLLWPAEDVSHDAGCRPREQLEAARESIRRALQSGLGAKRVMKDVLLYEAGEPEDFTQEHLAKLVKRLVPRSGLSAARRAREGLALTQVLVYDDAAVDADEVQGEDLFAKLWEFLVDPTPDGDSANRSVAANCARDFVEAARPEEVFQALDVDGAGTLSHCDFTQAMATIAPLMPPALVSRFREEFMTKANRVRYEGALVERLQLRPRHELEAMLQIIDALRQRAQQKATARDAPVHYLERLRARDVAGCGRLTREAFRDVLETDLGASAVLNETQMQMLLRWTQSEQASTLIDYERFGRMLAPSHRQVHDIMQRVTDHLRLSAAVAGGALDVREAFAHKDPIGSGHVSRADFVNIVRGPLALSPQPLSTRDVQLLMDDLDPTSGDMVDYVRFCARCLEADGEVSSLLQQIGEKARSALLRSRVDPCSAFWRRDPADSGLVDLEAFFDACEDLYVPCSREELLALVGHFGWLEAQGSAVRYSEFVEDLIRAGGPGGILCRAQRVPPGGAPVRGSDPVWNSFSVHQWLASGSTDAEAKAKFFEVHRSLLRAHDHSSGAPRTKIAKVT